MFAAIMMTSVGVLLCKSINLFVDSHESSRILDIQKIKGIQNLAGLFFVLFTLFKIPNLTKSPHGEK